MANEIVYDSTNLRAAEVLNREIWDLLFDATDLRQICTKVADLGGSGSAVSKTAQANFGTAMSAANGDEITPAGNSSLPVDNLSITIAQQIIAYELSDMMQITNSGNLGMAQLAQAVANAYIVRFTEMACSAGSGFSNTVGSSGVDLTVDDVYAAVFQLETTVNNPPFSAVLYPTQWTDLQESLRSEGGAVQFMPATAEALKIHGQGYKGSFLGVDWYTSDLIPDANGGADSAGFMMAAGGLAYAEASAQGALPGAIMAPSASPVYAEFDRVADPGLSRIVAHAFLGLSIGEDNRGVAIITDR
tara:strand:+ start:1733 stop:2641 length:909 start_codon:yes stop_codon:yes gene_type:complete